MTPPPPLPRISDYVAWWAARTPDAEAVVLGADRITYARLSAAVDRLAKALIAAGVEPGDRVATLQAPCPDYWTAFLATASVGAIWLGLNPRYRAAELAYAVGDAAPRLLLARSTIDDRRYDAEIAAMRATAPSIETVVLYGAPAFDALLARGDGVTDAVLAGRRNGCGGRDPCLLVYTSGSTGQPKGALLHHEGIVGVSLEQNRLWPVSPLRILNYLPINHVGCSVDVAAPCLVAGGTMVFHEHFDPGAAVRAIADERLTLLGSVPSALQMQVDHPDWATTDLSSLQLIVWEGAAIAADLLDRLLAVCPAMATNYGMTETTSAITAVAPTADRDVLLGSVGHAFPGVEVRLVGSDGRDAADGETGEVWARSRYNFLGYWRRPEASAETLTADGFLHTGDLAVRRPDGRFRIVGRLKEMFKSGGYNVYPREIEAVLEAHPAVAAAAVVGIPDPQWQEVGVAFVELAVPAEAGDLAAWCRERLANYKVPKRFVVLPGLPLLPIGKIDKPSLRRLAEAG